ncbi:hypothetical protein M0811_08766 [Anaeramoeba ignava]|uniref:Nucleoporin NDC1 n=1 Tax=Anaeramoeba ignava TaxID=1746090 RepID=A0A9Q0LL18_ANAIG|nr:hypothetical protein M0811_08766 [Anaeramoeba ignava]
MLRKARKYPHQPQSRRIMQYPSHLQTKKLLEIDQKRFNNFIQQTEKKTFLNASIWTLSFSIIFQQIILFIISPTNIFRRIMSFKALFIIFTYHCVLFIFIFFEKKSIKLNQNFSNGIFTTIKLFIGNYKKMFYLFEILLVSFILGKSWNFLLNFENAEVENINSQKNLIETQANFINILTIFIGIFYWFQIEVVQKRLIEFPLIQKETIYIAKQKLYRNLFKSLNQSLFVWIAAFVFSLFLLFFPQLSSYLLVGKIFQITALSSFTLRFLIASFVAVFALLQTLNFAWSLLEIFFTKPVQFSSQLDNSFPNQTLIFGLSCKYPIYKALSALDLWNLSRYSKLRRAAIFADDVNDSWAKIFNSAQEVFNSFLQPLWKRIFKIHTPLQEPPQEPQAQETSTRIYQHQHQYQQSMQDYPFSSSFKNPLQNQLQNPYLSAKYSKFQQKQSQPQLPKKLPFLISLLPDWPILDSLKSYFAKSAKKSTSQTNSENNDSFCLQQLSFFIESLANLVTFSYDEDSFGLIQNSIPKILSSFLESLLTIEDLEKINENENNSFLNENEHQVLKIVYEILKSSIYQITTKFHSSLTKFEFASVYAKKLQRFIDFRE